MEFEINAWISGDALFKRANNSGRILLPLGFISPRQLIATFFRSSSGFFASFKQSSKKRSASEFLARMAFNAARLCSLLSELSRSKISVLSTSAGFFCKAASWMALFSGICSEVSTATISAGASFLNW